MSKRAVALLSTARQAKAGRGAALRRGRALLAAGRPKDAVAALIPACEANPGDIALLRLNARALKAMGLRGPAIGALLVALEQCPSDAGARGELGELLFLDGHVEASLSHCRQAFEQDESADHATTLSAVLIDLGREAEALAVIARGLRHQPGSGSLLMNRSIALEGQGRMAEAVTAARHTLAARPGSGVAQHHLAAALLVQGELTAEAWRLYEGRLSMNGSHLASGNLRRWMGGPIAGKTLLLHAEQGLGDTLQFVRYAPLVAGLGSRVVLAVQPALKRLLQGTPGVDQVIGVGESLPDFDLYTPLLSLPGLFGTTLATIPPPLPYAAVRTPMRLPGKLRVGLAWAGSGDFVANRLRSMAAASLAAATRMEGTMLYGLQFGAKDMPAGVADAAQGVGDMADMAERVAGVDLVITVDTAMVHLAATMGKPVWLLSRKRGCWRWLLERQDSPWYPNVRIFRQQEANDWRKVLDEVRIALAELTATPYMPR